MEWAVTTRAASGRHKVTLLTRSHGEVHAATICRNRGVQGYREDG